MKATVLVIGQNVERQIIELSADSVLVDEVGRSWLDVVFDNRALSARATKRQFSQIASLKRALELLNFKVVMSGGLRDFAVRTVLKVGQNCKVIRTGRFDDYLWEKPQTVPRAIVLLESANLSPAALSELNEYLDVFPKIKLVVEYHNQLLETEAGKKLVERAKLVWVDLISQQAGETEEILNQFKFKNQLLLVNHNSGLSLSDHERTYKLTNADYLELKSLEWLAIAIKTLNYQFDAEDQLELIARIGQSVVRTNQANVGQNLAAISRHNPEIELIRGEPNLKKILVGRAEELTSGLMIEAGEMKLEQLREMLAVRDLPLRARAVMLAPKHWTEVARSDLRNLLNLTEKIALGWSLPVSQRNLAGCGRETVSEVTDLEAMLSQAEFAKVRVIKASAEFLLGQTTPSDRIILANASQLAEFAKRATSRGMTPIVAINTTMQVNHDGRAGAVALEFLRILRALEVELRVRSVDLKQVIIYLNLPNVQGQKTEITTAKQWINTIQEQISKYHLNLTNIKFGVDLEAAEFVELNRQVANLYLQTDNLENLLASPMTNDELRIKISQFLVNFNK